MSASPTSYLPDGFVIPMSTEMTISQWHVPIDDENCSGTRSSPLIRRRSTRRRCATSGSNCMSFPIIARARTRRTITDSIRRSRRPQPSPAWAATSRARSMGGGIDGRDPGTAPASISARRQGHRAVIAACWRQESSKAASGTNPSCLDAAHARSIRPATMDGIARRGAGQTFWMEVDVGGGRRAMGRTGTAGDCDKVRHLKAV